MIRHFMQELKDDHVSAYAAQAAYFLLLSAFPFLLLLMSLIPYTPFGSEEVIAAFLPIIPEKFQDMVIRIMQEVYTKSKAAVPLSLIVAMWSAGKGLQSIANGFNSVYDVKETRGYLATRLQAIVYTLVFIFAIVMSLILQVFGNSIQMKLTEYIPGLFHLFEMIIGVRTLVSIAMLTLIFAAMYKFVPNRKSTWKSQLPGALAASIAWSVFSFAFSLYFDLRAGAWNMYGSMTGIVLALLWVYFGMYIVLLGAEMNSMLEGKFDLTDK